MGNQVTTLGQIYPVDYYLIDYCNDMTLDVSLGSTRFMKVARVRHKDVGYCVAKVYAINDTSIPIQEHKQKIEFIRDSIKSIGELSALPFLACSINDKCAIILRQYIKYNLYDRLSTRPFLTSIEKRWIAYQLLRCVQSLHKQSIYHGDIKSENVLVTSFLWITLADFASYKPVVLPANNPSDFSYFFDTSRRHICNMAPERFVEPPGNPMAPDPSSADTKQDTDFEPQTFDTDPNNSSSGHHLLEDVEAPTELTAQMDLFSLGCVFAELFSDDTPNSSMFDLGQILMFRKGKYDPTEFIDQGITDSRVKRLILNLTDLDPSKRNSASYHLEQLVPSLFPAYFQTLYDYFRKLIPLEADAKILRLEKDLEKLMDEIITEDEHGLLLPLLLATSTLRSLKGIDQRLIGLKLCLRLIESSSVMAEYTIDRLLPYIVQLLGKSESRVRALCVSSLNRALKHVTRLQLSDTNVFIDYILPSLLPLAYDPSSLVRIALASTISELAETAKRFLDRDSEDYNLKLNSLQEAFGGIVSQLLVDPNNNVRRAVLNENILMLCNFFDAERTDEVILSHIITFLNDKSDFRLRASFFDNICSIIASLGINYAPVVKPLMQKGLADSEEMVIYKSLNAISDMTEKGLLTKEVVYELFQDAVLFISFPNKWIRNAVINFVLVLSKPEGPFSNEFGDRILPCMKLHLIREISAFHDASVLLDSLQNPLPRVVIESILNGDHDIDEIFHSITERKRLRGKKRFRTTTNESDSQDYDTLADGPSSGSSMQRYENELSLNIDRLSEDRLLDSEETLRRIHRNKRTSSSRQVEPNISVRRQDVVLIQSSGSIGVPNIISSIGGLSNSPTLANNATLSSATYADSQLLMSSSVSGLTRSLRPRGVLLAHLHEHKGAVNKLIVVPGTSQFISCSNDATIKFWDCTGVSTKPQVLFRSKQTFVSPDAGAFTTISACLGTDTLLALSESSNLHLLQLCSPSSHSRLIKTVNLNASSSEPEMITELISLSPYTYATCSTSSNIRGYDLRLPTASDVWNLKMEGSAGLITCMDGNEYCIACGTSSSVISMFDLRFYIRATSMSYPLFQEKMKKRIRKIVISNDEIYCSVDGNNEVSTWDCESASRTKTLWASNAPCLSSRHSSHHSVLSMVIDSNKEMSSVITAGDDMKIRFWDLNNPSRSYPVSRPAYNSYHKLRNGSKAPPEGDPNDEGFGTASQVYYQTKLVDGIQVIQETDKMLSTHSGGGNAASQEPAGSRASSGLIGTPSGSHSQQSGSSLTTPPAMSSSKTGPSSMLQLANAASAAHRDSISCLAAVQQSSLLLSASRDGVIKIWR